MRTVLVMVICLLGCPPKLRHLVGTSYNVASKNHYGPSRMDPLSDVIALLRPHAAISKPITGRGNWGVRYQAYGQPGFAIVTAGHCWLALDGDPQLRLERGDFVLLPASPAF